MVMSVGELNVVMQAQDENRHGDFFAAILKARPECLNDWKAKLWSRFFCHSVYITMYLNDHMRSSFYESIGLNTTQFDQHVIIETNNSTARTFPAVCSCGCCPCGH
jgi:magnesium-protoporphyrin IX monomethyl ester (oxidative) cyclase